MFEITKKITSLSDVKSFARYLYEEAKVVFHPDDSFEDYINIDTHNRSFSKSEAAILNQRMEECFNVCEKENEDIYEVMMEFSPLHV